MLEVALNIFARLKELLERKEDYTVFKGLIDGTTMLVRVYPRGQRVEYDDLIYPVSFSFLNPQELIGTYCLKNKVIYQTPSQTKIREYKTPHLIKEIELLSRTEETESEFIKEERTHYTVIEPGDITQILNLYCIFDKNPHPDEELSVNERIDEVGAFFAVDYENSLEKLIAIHVWNGWTRLETIAAIQNLIKLQGEDYQLEQLEWLRQAVDQNPEFLDQSQAA